MKLTILALMTTLVALVASKPHHSLHRRITTTPSNTTNSTAAPVNYGVILFRNLDMMDVFGPLDVLQIAAHQRHLNLHLIAADLRPVTTESSSAAMNKLNSSFWPTFQPTATFDDDLDLDVLIVPGGPGVRAPGLEPVVDYVKRYYPKVKHLITICTGASFAARAGVLDGKRATTNKRAWATITAMGPDVKWVAPARYVVDGNIWSSSGVVAGLDVTFAFVKEMYGEEMATQIANTMEHLPYPSDFDPFTEIHGVTPTSN